MDQQKVILAQERERCAQVAESCGITVAYYDGHEAASASMCEIKKARAEIAAAIRALSE
jgi:hypothetical protein